MARTANALGHDYIVLTDHSPRLTVAHGLTRERLEDQLDVVAGLNEQLAPFRILTGIECDINLDGTLDQDADLLARLDVVVGSVHSKLRMPSEDMTPRMVAAVANPHARHPRPLHRPQAGRPRPARRASSTPRSSSRRAATFDVAVEVNSRPERLDPPMRLLRLAVEMGCIFSIDTDAHATGQLDWQPYGCARAEVAGVTPDRVVNTRTADELVAWAAGRR